MREGLVVRSTAWSVSAALRGHRPFADHCLQPVRVRGSLEHHLALDRDTDAVRVHVGTALEKGDGSFRDLAAAGPVLGALTVGRSAGT